MKLVETVLELIDLLNVTEIEDETETNVSESEGEVEETLGAKLSVDCVGGSDNNYTGQLATGR